MRSRPHAEPSLVLQANSEAYEWLVAKIRAMDRRDAEAVLREVETAAWFAGEHHPGRFADGALENAALEIGAALDADGAAAGEPPLRVARQDGRRRVLHVTPAIALGGHTPLVRHWVQNDRSSCHSVALVNQRGEIPARFVEVVRRSGGDVIALAPRSPLGARASWLRDAARRSADLVVLHLIGPDVVPTVAFATDECPPVAAVDHCDHTFWLGSTVADLLVNLRAAGSEHTAARRFVPSSTVLPIPLLDRARSLSRRDARRALGIEEGQVVLLSVGRAIKYRPCGPYDFVATASLLLDRQPDAHLYVVGESAAGIAPYLRCAAHERLHFSGSVPDPAPYRAAADIYLESFPYGSQTALLEAALSGLPVVPAYAPLSPLLVANDDALADVLPNPRDEQEYLERAEELIRQPEARAALGETLRERLLADHVGEGWLNRLAALYRQTDRLVHRPRPIPASRCMATDADLGLSQWHVMADGRTSSTGLSDDPVGAARHAAYVSRLVGDYGSARWHALRAVREDPFGRDSWRLLAVTIPGRAARLVREALSRRAAEVTSP